LFISQQAQEVTGENYGEQMAAQKEPLSLLILIREKEQDCDFPTS
jgi:hypothetical protein